jgi:hypothetical protein
MTATAANAPWTGKLRTMFSDDRSFWRLAAVLLGLIAFLKGIRIPNLWSATQAMVNYDHGVVKRGLFGATFGHWFHLERYVRFTVISCVLLLLFVGMLIWLTAHSGIFTRVGLGVPVVVFASSYAVTYLASLIGYFDIPLGILAVATLLIRNTWLRFAVAVPVCVVALLIHELFFFVFLPVILFSFILDGTLTSDRRRRIQMWVMCALLVCVSGAVTVRMAQEKLITRTEAKALLIEDMARADFPVKRDFYSLLTRSSKDNLRAMKDVYINPTWDFYVGVNVVRLLPVAVLLMLPILAISKTFPKGRTRTTITVAALVAAFSPLFMHVLGWDNARWNALACLTMFLVLLMLTRSLPVPYVALSAGYRNAAILVMAVSMATGGGLLDDQEIKTFPFASPAREMLRMMRHGRWDPPPPDPHPIDPGPALN